MKLVPQYLICGRLWYCDDCVDDSVDVYDCDDDCVDNHVDDCVEDRVDDFDDALMTASDDWTMRTALV
jgi:hypothetical protein